MKSILILFYLAITCVSAFAQNDGPIGEERVNNVLDRSNDTLNRISGNSPKRCGITDECYVESFQNLRSRESKSDFEFEFPKERVEPINVRQKFEFDVVQKDDFQKDEKDERHLNKALSPFDERIVWKDNDNPKSVVKFHWKNAIAESLVFLSVQHAFRMVQSKTRDELNGPFFRDWGKSVRNLGGWRDGDSLFTNYVAHPMQGAVTGRIFLNNSDKARKQEFGSSRDYWETRVKALAWSAVWSAQFELGPISEASIGNVGLYDREGPNRMGWVDLVITPFAGTLVIVGEDAIDKYVLDHWLERKVGDGIKLRLFRTFITPFQSFTNVLNGRRPWYRGNR